MYIVLTNIYMWVFLQVWDTELERSAEDWAHTCLWEHGPAHLLTQIGQNLGAHWGRYGAQSVGERREM